MRGVILFTLFATFFGSLSFAGEIPKTYGLSCSTSVSGASVWVNGSRLFYHFDDKEGFQDFPIYSGVVSPSMLGLVNRGKTDLADFDGHLEVSWDLSQCTLDDTRPYLISCHGASQISVPETTPITATSLATSVTSTESMDSRPGDDDVLNLDVGLDTPIQNYTHYVIRFNFKKDNCVLREAKPGGEAI